MKISTDRNPPTSPATGIAVESVEEKMRSLCADSSQPNDIYLNALDNHLKAGGQRTRAKISLTSGTRLGLPKTDSIALAASVELLHNASLIQDDLQDKARMRRGAPTVWSQHGANCAIGLTDLTIAAAFRALGSISNPGALPGLIDFLYRAISITLRGQTDDLSGNTTCLADAVSVARRKSGPLFALALELPLFLAGRHTFLAQASEAAHSFGLGYQIYDDIIDVDEDRASRSQSNTVVALEIDQTPREALNSARDLAKHHLSESATLALELPASCGQGLADLAIHIEGRLDALFDE
jgi:geranylgeranyl diphosphate synthase type II